MPIETPLLKDKLEKISLAVAYHLDHAQDTPNVMFPDGQFPAASLSRWLPLVDGAGVPAIGVTVIGEVQVSSILKFDQVTRKVNGIDLVVPGMELALDELLWINKVNCELESNEMLRWDTCCPFGVKLAMSEPRESGGRPSANNLHLVADDPRAFDILYEHPELNIKVLKRPWLDALILDGYPVEFRVFVQNNEVIGVSSYYLQRALPNTGEIIYWAEQSAAYAKSIVNACQDARTYPVNIATQAGFVNKVTATIDFLVTKEGELLFIEAGPGYGFGAHPCCYTGKSGVSRIEGIKLGVDVAVVPFKSEDILPINM